MQRAAIARVLAQNPELILADEPTGNLDRTNSIEILNLFKHMNEQGHTIILVTHDPEVADYAQKQMILDNGSFRRA
jgi:putative ABC transport system ATP-binding protein